MNQGCGGLEASWLAIKKSRVQFLQLLLNRTCRSKIRLVSVHSVREQRKTIIETLIIVTASQCVFLSTNPSYAQPTISPESQSLQTSCRCHLNEKTLKSDLRASRWCCPTRCAALPTDGDRRKRDVLDRIVRRLDTDQHWVRRPICL